MDKQELDLILEKHELWLKDEDGGERANLRGADLIGANLSEANLRGAYLIGADLRGANLIGANLRWADLIGADLIGADLIGANLSEANLIRADLIGANLSEANLRGANLSEADLSEANLRGANLSEADLRGAYLIGANLSEADLGGANLRRAIGNGKEIKTISIEKYIISYTKDRMQIGCKNYSYEEWFSFSNEEIDEMDNGALDWWNKYKDWLKQTIELSPAEGAA